jgi:Predicted metal-binding integral membrane protein (DUF2182)
MASSGAYAIPRGRNLILAALFVLAAAAWALLIWQAANPATMGMGLTMGMGAPLFLTIWVVMMVAMMFPTTAPMIVTFARVQASQRERRRRLRSNVDLRSGLPRRVDRLRCAGVRLRRRRRVVGRSSALDHEQCPRVSAVSSLSWPGYVMPAGSGRLALSVSRKMMRAAGVSVGDAADFEIERLSAATEPN